MSDSGKYSAVKVTQVWRWTDHLFSFRTERPDWFRFQAGQFARLGLAEAEDAPPSVWRAYSIVSGPYDDFLEYYSIVVPDGAFTSRLKDLQPGGTLFMERQNHGFLTLERFALQGDLFLLASGTGLAPYLSILADPLTWDSFDRIVLVHSVRLQNELAYREHIESLAENELFKDNAYKLIYLPTVTREPSSYLNARIPQLIQTGALEQKSNTPLSKERSKFMLCGNPEMVQETRIALKEKGFVSARSSRPGEIATENYW
ncbi:MAG: ferredoxin--NADP reductase [Burkholderiaceae bacterium]